MADKKEDDVAQLNAIKMALRMGHSLLKYQVEFLVAMTERAIATPPADAALADALESVALGDAMATKELMRQAAAALRARAVPDELPLSALVCVGRARFPRTGGNAGIAWHVEDALSDTGGFRSGSPCNGELLFVLPTTAKRAMLAASKRGE